MQQQVAVATGATGQQGGMATVNGAPASLGPFTVTPYGPTYTPIAYAPVG